MGAGRSAPSSQPERGPWSGTSYSIGTAPQPRPRLAFLLWPDSTEAQARTNLRKVLHTLRRDTPELEPFLAITAQTVQWVATGLLEVDVEVFESALATDGDGNAEADVGVPSRRWTTTPGTSWRGATTNG